MKTCKDCDWNVNGVCSVLPVGQRHSVFDATPACQYHKHSIQQELPLDESEGKKKRQILKD
jgi:hypothetical protein